jgi:outer membrane protein assembly factor BamB
MSRAAVYVGVKGNVIALDRATGEEIWSARLKGSDFVNVVLDGDVVLATTKGEVFCLEAATGILRWQNELPGLGWGLVTIATASGSSILPPFRKKQADDEAAAAAG